MGNFSVPTANTVLKSDWQPAFKTTIRRYLDCRKTHALVKPFYRIGDHMSGVPGCFDLLPVRMFYNIIGSHRYVDTTFTQTEACEVCHIQMITAWSKRDGSGDRAFGPMPTDKPDLYIVVLLPNVEDLVRDLRVS